MRSISPASIASASHSHNSEEASRSSLPRQRDWQYEGIDRIHLYVTNLNRWRNYFQSNWQFEEIGWQIGACTHSVWLSQADIHLIVSAGTSDRSPVSSYLQKHPPGIVDVALRVSNLDAVERHLKRVGQRLTNKWQLSGDRGGTVLTPFGIRHSLVQRANSCRPVLPEFSISPQQSQPSAPLFTNIDHAVLNVGQGQLNSAIEWYRRVLDLRILYRFTISTPRSGLSSVVMGETIDESSQNRPGYSLQLPINEPTDRQSQIQEFLDANHGPGIQHVAFHSRNILGAVPILKSRGVTFLDIPDGYYDKLANLPALNGGAKDMLQALKQHRLLLDCKDADRLLLQTFTRPIFDEPTLFFEAIERRQRATGFGEGNFQALFEAVERAQMHRQQSPARATETPG